MGLVVYYRRIIKVFSNIAYTITCIQKKDIKFNWNDKYETNFQMLKQRLKTAPILKVFNPFGDFAI